MSDFEYILILNDNSSQFFQEKRLKIFILGGLEFFEIHFVYSWENLITDILLVALILNRWKIHARPLIRSPYYGD